MTTTYDPQHPRYRDEADVRDELTRVYDVCHGCQRCVELCTSFPTMFEFIDRHEDRDPGRLTPAQQDQVVEECFQCKRCYSNCPYTPPVHEAAVDFPRLMLRAAAMRHDAGHVGPRHAVTSRVLGHTDLVGKLATSAGPVANQAVGAPPGSAVRRVVERVTGVSSQRLLPPFARERFSTWFARRPKVRITGRQGRVAVFPTCLVEYQEPAIGHALVRVYERNGLECTLVDGAVCCGAPYLHSGDVDRFAKAARENVRALAAAIRSGRDVVVPQPTCGYVLTHDYPDHVGGDDARLVAEHTSDAAEYLMELHHGAGTSLDMDFGGAVPTTITYHTPCHLRAQGIGLRSRDLLKLTGARVTLVERCSGTGTAWGLRAANAHIAVAIAGSLGAEVERAGGDVVAGDCHLANTAILEQTGRRPLHPLQVIARAYGIADEVS